MAKKAERISKQRAADAFNDILEELKIHNDVNAASDLLPSHAKSKILLLIKFFKEE